jgi:predicted nucleic acid-binding protein
MLRVVIDTNVVAAAFRSRLGASFALIELVRRKRIRILATPPLFLEYEDVLKRPEQLAGNCSPQYHGIPVCLIGTADGLRNDA